MTHKEDLLEQIFRDIGHDFKSPLTAIIGALEILSGSSTIPAEQQKKLNQLALSESYRLLQYIETMMQYTRLTSQTIVPDRSKIQLNELVGEASVLFSRKYPQLTFLTDDIEGLEVYADRKLLSQALVQIFDNAGRYNPGDKPVTVTIRGQINPSGALSLLIADDGIGIARNDAAHIFEPYNKGLACQHKNTTAGLGLTIARKIMTLHGGSVDLKTDHAPNDRYPAAFDLILPQ